MVLGESIGEKKITWSMRFRMESEAMIEAKFQAIYGTLVFGPAHTSSQKEVTQEVWIFRNDRQQVPCAQERQMTMDPNPAH